MGSPTAVDGTRRHCGGEELLSTKCANEAWCGNRSRRATDRRHARWATARFAAWLDTSGAFFAVAAQFPPPRFMTHVGVRADGARCALLPCVRQRIRARVHPMGIHTDPWLYGSRTRASQAGQAGPADLGQVRPTLRVRLASATTCRYTRTTALNQCNVH